MNVSDCYYLGVISKTFGYKGELIFALDVDDPSHYSKMESVFVQINDKLVPFFIQTISPRPNSHLLFVRFEGIDTVDKAMDLCGCELYLPLTRLSPLSGKQFYYHEIQDYDVVDAMHGHIGKIRQVLDFPGNPLFQIEKGQIEILIPIRDEFILHLDRPNRTLHLQAPEGLIDMYFSGQ